MRIVAPLSRRLVAGLLLCSAPPVRAQADTCGMLKPADLTALLGGSPTATPHPNACIWNSGDGARKLSLTKMKATGPAAEMSFAGARQGAAHGGKTTVTDEPGLGDKAFSTLQSFGVAMVLLKEGRMMQLANYTPAAGAPKGADALRPVAKKAIAAF